jgi:hypothetical protein
LIHRLFGILAILIFLFEIYRFLRGSWLRQILQKKKDPQRSRKPWVMKPKSERDCPFCMQEQGKRPFSKPDPAGGLEPTQRTGWAEEKSSDGRVFLSKQKLRLLWDHG